MRAKQDSSIVRDQEKYKASWLATLPQMLEIGEFSTVNETLVQLIRDYLDFHGIKDAVRCLELGCGPGTLTELLLDRLHPRLMVGVDSCEIMVRNLQDRFRGRESVKFICQDIIHFFAKPHSLDDLYDVIATSFTLHHLLPQERSAIFRSCREWLNAPGLFIDGDVFIDPDEHAQKFITSCVDRRLKAILSEDEYNIRLEHRKLEYRCSVEAAIKELKEAGFDYAFCPYKNSDRSIVMALVTSSQ